MTPERFADEYQKGFPATVRFLASRGVETQKADDFAQSAWLRAWSVREQWLGTSSFRTWVNVIAWNIVRDSFRRKREEPMPDTRIEPSTASHEEAVNASVDTARILRRMPRGKAAFLKERYLDEMDVADIRESHGYTANSSVRIALRRAVAIARATAA